MVMLSVRFVPDGMEILNQHSTVIAAVPVFQLNAPVGSLAFRYAVPGNVAARAGIIGKTNVPATARANRQRRTVLKNGLKL